MWIIFDSSYMYLAVRNFRNSQYTLNLKFVFWDYKRNSKSIL